ncbi:hypothetical protein [Amycolatopsis sp. MtRt-6]|uniref:hypothetical protein n=1 Tax=Amycolatopsis sp. MtRt-6 TaxID=2792782 RepID=UPI001A8D0BB7|nr:hypothetical protein [Amycolatopsis sp. MtRt-6]
MDILAFLVARYGNRMARDRLAEAAERATSTLLRVAGNHRLHEPVVIADARALIRHQSAEWDSLLAASPPREPGIRTLATGMAQADVDYLSRNSGRPRAGAVDSNGSGWMDGWTGLLAYHSVLGRSTGMAEFDSLFAAIRASVLSSAAAMTPPIVEALRLHFRHHPEDAARIPDSPHVIRAGLGWPEVNSCWTADGLGA